MTALSVVPATVRKAQRRSYGDLQTVLDRANDDLRDGEIRNALAGYREALGQWLRLKWLAVTGKHATPTVDPQWFLQKLRCGLYIDAATMDAVKLALKAWKKPTRETAEVVRAIVLAVCADFIQESEGGVI